MRAETHTLRQMRPTRVPFDDRAPLPRLLSPLTFHAHFNANSLKSFKLCADEFLHRTPFHASAPQAHDEIACLANAKRV